MAIVVTKTQLAYDNLCNYDPRSTNYYEFGVCPPLELIASVIPVSMARIS